MVVTVSYEEPSTSTRKMLSQVSKTLNINADNYDILQKLDLPVGQEVSVTIKGTGKAIMTIGTFWHTKALPLEPTFNVVSEATRKDGTTSVLQKVEIERVSGSGEGMIIASLQVFSGMVPEPLSLSGLKGSKSACNGAVKRVDYANDEVSVYIDGIAMGDAPCQLELKLQEDMPVKNLQPAAVEVFEYYDPQKSGAAETSSDIKVVLDFDSPDGSTNSASPASVAITFGHALLAAAAYLYLAN